MKNPQFAAKVVALVLAGVMILSVVGSIIMSFMG
ncbi:MAG: hypothetical protein K0R90_1061 [Oscillospiraceae bacterium]|jgi:hypothetical protein|nr:hypothetical protein [Oscillospiraceae bacterium]